MIRNKFKKALSVVLACTMCLSLAACGKKDGNGDNQSQPTKNPTDSVTQNDTPLVVGYLEFSQKFSPFFSDSSYDSDVAGMTQVSLLTTDRTGGLILNGIEGETKPYNGTDYTYTGISDIKTEYNETTDITTYNIKIRDDIKFSDGHLMDADDIIFTYYVLSDTSYDGSSTLYSVPIVGMENYRKNNSNAENVSISDNQIKEALNQMTEAVSNVIVENVIVPTLTEELEWVKSLYSNEKYKEQTTAYPVVKDLFAYYYNIDDSYDSKSVEDEAQVLADIIAQYGSDYKTLGNNYGGDEDYFLPTVEGLVKETLLNEQLSGTGEEVSNIEGIKKLSPTEVEVQVKGFDASAIYKVCGISVAPMHYYGSEDLYDYDNNQFGFTRGDVSAIKDKTTKPMGAGPYKFVKYDNKVVYFEANENYYRGEPLTKYVQFKETAEADKISGVGTGTIDIADPSGSVSGFDEISSYNSNKELSGNVISTQTVDHLGYGYIGLNADTMNVAGDPDSEESKNLRKAFATIFSIYRDVTIDSYYGDVADVINYPISNTSWAAPQKSDEDYQVAYSVDVDGNPIVTADMTDDEKYESALQATIGYFKAAGYTFDEATQKFTKAPEGAKLEYEIIIGAGGQGDHPSFAILGNAKEDLASIGITLTINDPSNANELWNRLDVGTQEMFVAAWSATIDPDMYQIYHSSNIVGLGGTDSNHFHIADKELDQLILDARSSADQSYRKALYKSCLDTILDWAVEIPIYQRQNCIIFSEERIDTSTITPDITTYWGWTNDIEKIKMK